MLISWTTVHEAIETGLNHVLAAEPAASKPFLLKRCPFKGTGRAQRESWPKIRAKIYSGRGA
jgi:hypothetical protein